MRRYDQCAALALATVMAAAGPAMAQTAPAAAPMAHPESAADSQMMAAMTRMSQAMDAVPMTGDTDRDFAAMMIPHHMAAIEMAQVELAHGKDPAMRKLARAIVAAQRSEIATMTAWLTRHDRH